MTGASTSPGRRGRRSILIKAVVVRKLFFVVYGFFFLLVVFRAVGFLSASESSSRFCSLGWSPAYSIGISRLCARRRPTAMVADSSYIIVLFRNALPDFVLGGGRLLPDAALWVEADIPPDFVLTGALLWKFPGFGELGLSL